MLNAMVNEAKQQKFKNKDVQVKLVFQIQEKNKQRNAEIMKKLLRKRFQSVNERRVKSQNLNERLQKAEERRNLIIKKKVEKAIELAVGGPGLTDCKVSQVAQADDVESIESLLKVQQMPINPQSQRQTQAENDSDFEIVDKDEVDPIAKEMREEA